MPLDIKGNPLGYVFTVLLVNFHAEKFFVPSKREKRSGKINMQIKH